MLFFLSSFGPETQACELPRAEPSPCPVSFYPQFKSVWGVIGKAPVHADTEAGKEVLASPSSRCAPGRQEALGGEETRTHRRRPSFPPASRPPHGLDDVPLLLSTPIFHIDMAGERRAQFGVTVEGNRAIYLSSVSLKEAVAAVSSPAFCPNIGALMANSGLTGKLAPNSLLHL